MFHTLCLGVLLCVAGSQALYDSSSEVVDLTPNNFDRLVTNSEEIWIVEFYAPWCGHCKNLVPEYKKAAKALKGIIKVGAVDADQHKSLSGKYGVTGFPTIKIFTGSKHTPYQGQRSADAFVDAGIKAAKERAYDNLGKKTGGSGDKRQGYGHNIPWKKIKRAVARLGNQHHTPQVGKQATSSLKISRKPQVQKLSSLKPHTQKKLNRLKPQVPVTVNKFKLNNLHHQLFRSNTQQNREPQDQKLRKVSRKPQVQKLQTQSIVPQVAVTEFNLGNLVLFRSNVDDRAQRQRKLILRNHNLPLKLKRPGRQKNIPKRLGNRVLAKTRQKNKYFENQPSNK